MRKYGSVAPQFWIGETGQKLAAMGSEIQLLAVYLMTCPNSNMIGLYHLPIGTIAEELPCPSQGASNPSEWVRMALRRVYEAGFASWDGNSKTIYVYEMARFQIGEVLKAKDKRRSAIEKELEVYRKSIFYNDFLDKYAAKFRLRNERKTEGASKGHTASAHLVGQEQEQEQEQNQEQNHKQDQNAPPNGARAEIQSSRAVADPNHPIVKLAKETWKRHGLDEHGR